MSVKLTLTLSGRTLERYEFEEFERLHPGVRVEVETLTWQNGFEKILAALES